MTKTLLTFIERELDTMKNVTFLIVGLLLCTLTVNAQDRNIAVDTTVITAHTVTINGAKIEYNATTGLQPFWD